jgi:hypothetical protein
VVTPRLCSCWLHPKRWTSTLRTARARLLSIRFALVHHFHLGMFNLPRVLLSLRFIPRHLCPQRLHCPWPLETDLHPPISTFAISYCILSVSGIIVPENHISTIFCFSTRLHDSQMFSMCVILYIFRLLRH